jgi:hypothetical protein
MTRCIWCGEEIEGSVKDHMAEKHLGIHFTNGAPPPDIDTSKSDETLPIAPTSSDHSENTTKNTISPAAENKQKPNTPALPLEKPKKHYLTGAEIITLLQNTNKQFLLNEIQGCPLTKENE